MSLKILGTPKKSHVIINLLQQTYPQIYVYLESHRSLDCKYTYMSYRLWQRRGERVLDAASASAALIQHF